jgi:hypothetical protein
MRRSYRTSPAGSVAVMIRQCRMIGYYDHDDHRFIGIQNEPTMKLVVTFRRNSSVWTVLRVMIMYASVDAILLLPILILFNVVSIWHVLSLFTDAEP